MTREELSHLKTLAQAATPGPWTAENTPYDGFTDPVISSGEVYVAQTVYDMQSWSSRHDVDADTAYIAAASPDVVLALIARIEELQTPTLSCPENK